MSPQSGRPVYYSEISIDPNQEDRVYILATSSHKSEDGGRTSEEFAVCHTFDVGPHADHHALGIVNNDWQQVVHGDVIFWQPDQTDDLLAYGASTKSSGPARRTSFPGRSEPRGHLVSPGTYTPTLEARGASISTTVVVRSDPEIPLTQAQHEARETFLNEVVAPEQEFSTVLGPSGGAHPGRVQPDSNLSEEERVFQQYRRQVIGVYDSLNASGVRLGSSFRATETQGEIAEAARGALRNYLG